MKDLWKHRRIMTYITLVAALFVFPALLIKYEVVLSIAVYYYGLTTGLVMAYFGSSHFDDKDKRVNKDD